MKRISVIVPVYNVEKHLEKCLESLVNQSLSDLEILVINDGSTDGSQKIIELYQNNYPEKVFGFYKENGGLSDARNFGIERANGAYLGFVDGDDFVSPCMFSEMYALAEKHQAEMVICNLQKVDEDENVVQQLTQIPNLPEKIKLEDHFSIFSDVSYFACNKIFKASLFKDERFKKGIHFEDIELIPKLLLQCNTIAQTQSFYYQYLERANSISKTHTEKGLDILQAIESVEEVFKKSNFANRKQDLKNFQILEGVYTFLAYAAFVKNEESYYKMMTSLEDFRKRRSISFWNLMRYKRFGENYFLSLPIKKQVYYFLSFLGLYRFIRKALM